jgi:hypothetical protein
MKNKRTHRASGVTRRAFIGAAVSLTAFTIVPRHVLGGAGKAPPSETLNVACIGVGGKGHFDLLDVSRAGGNIVALCDVDEKRAGMAFEQFPKARRYRDFRKLLEQEEKNIDAVVVATPDHVHIPASVMAMKLGKHVYSAMPDR